MKLLAGMKIKGKKIQKIAILGASGHIAKSLTYAFKDEPTFYLHLFTHSYDKTKLFAENIKLQNAQINTYRHFNNFHFSSIINCTGIGDPDRLRDYPEEVFFVSEEIELLISNYLKIHRHTTYINISSGAVYGTKFLKEVDDNTITEIAINNLSNADFYGIAKINSEAKHRSMQKLNIIDLRIFGFFSQFIELNRSYLLSEIINCLKSNKTFITSESNIIRDYIHPIDFANLVKKCMMLDNINMAIDVYSKNPISKFEMLQYFKSMYNLNYEIKTGISNASVTGNKDYYFSKSRKVNEIGFKPQYTSLECIDYATNKILSLQ